MRPIDVNHENAQEVRQKVYGKSLEAQQLENSKFEKGDKIRVAKQRTVFDKAYLPNYTDEVFEVDKVIHGKPNTYNINTKDGVSVDGRFYEDEMTRTKHERDKKLVIEKVLKTRKRGRITEYLVKWKNRPDSNWITMSDVLPSDKF